MAPKKKPYNQLSKSAKHYRDNADSRNKKKSYDTKTQSDSKSKNKRAELGRKRTAAKKAGKDISGKDYDHKQGKFIESSKNRGQAEKSRLSKKKK